MFRKYDLIINHNKRCSDYHIYISNRVNIPVSKMEYEDINIIGRHGTLTKEHGYLDKEIKVSFNFFDPLSMPKLIRHINTLFTDVKEIMFTDDDEEYYRVKKVTLGDVERQIRHYGFFDVAFTVEPFAYDTRVYPLEITNNNYRLMNPASYYSLPKITIYGTGDITLTINNTITKFNNVDDYITVDSEILETYKDEILQNDKKVGEFFTFNTGENIISWVGNVQKIVIEPRWRWL